MTRALSELLSVVEPILTKEPKLIELPDQGKAVFIGDTHGDSEATTITLDRYLKPGYTLVFLGDYVDRGKDSAGNISLLLEAKIKHPKQIVLLQGNHEGWKTTQFLPCNFWLSLHAEERALCAEVLAHLPLAAHAANGLIALHGALPGVPDLSSINEIPLGSDLWYAVTWGDFQGGPGHFLGTFKGNSQFGKDYFEEMMRRLGKTVLIRGHQPGAPLFLFEDRCLTLITSSSHAPLPRRIAIADLSKPITKTTELIIEEI